jgi:hypothetical protein
MRGIEEGGGLRVEGGKTRTKDKAVGKRKMSPEGRKGSLLYFFTFEKAIANSISTSSLPLSRPVGPLSVSLDCQRLGSG